MKWPYLQEQLECIIRINFFLESLLRYRIMPNIRWVRQPEFSRSVQEYISNPQDDRALLALTDIHHLQQTTVAFAQVQNVPEYFIDEIFEKVRREHRRICSAERLDEDRFNKVEVLQVLFLACDESVDDANYNTGTWFNRKLDIYIKGYTRLSLDFALGQGLQNGAIDCRRPFLIFLGYDSLNGDGRRDKDMVTLVNQMMITAADNA
jgi:hypothetical protein